MEINNFLKNLLLSSEILKIGAILVLHQFGKLLLSYH
jgi:hypothetical protein